MEDLLQSQIRESCKLALPNGLKDLMADISREVLRAQPANLFQFITDYLSVMLVTRENLNVAAKVCDDICKSHCCPELEDELRKVGLSDEDVEKTLEIVTTFLENGAVNEGNLLIKLLKKTEMEASQLPAVLAAVRHAFLKNQVNNTAQYESSSSDSDLDETLAAAKHTLKLYKKVKEPDENYNAVVVKIQAAYRAYNLRRKRDPYRQEQRPLTCKKAEVHEKSLRFETKKMEELYPPSLKKRCASKASSISLAGSFITLPPYKPYSANDCSDIVEQDELAETENTNIDYTTSQNNWNDFPGYSGAGNIKKDIMNKKSISFHELPQIIDADSAEVIDDVTETDHYDEDYDSEEITEDVELEETEIGEDVEVKEIIDDDEVKNIGEDEFKQIGEDEFKEIVEDEFKEILKDELKEIVEEEIGEDEFKELGEDDGVIEIDDDSDFKELGEQDEFKDIGEDDIIKKKGEHDEAKEIDENDGVIEIDDDSDFKELGEQEEFEEIPEDVIHVEDMYPVDLTEPLALAENLVADEENDVGGSFTDDSQSS